MIRKRKNMWIGILILLSLILFYVLYWRQSSVLLSFTNSEVILSNPDRGFYFQLDSKEYHRLNEYKDSEERFRLVLLTINLIEDMNHEVISKAKIEEVNQALESCRDMNFGVIIRAAYHFFGDNYDQPKEFTTILQHVSQLSEVLNQYADVILGVQAGFIGPYGEWHNSKYMENDVDGVPFRVKLLQLLDSELNQNIAINIRRPMFIREALAYGLSIDRLGIHNDALLSTDTDMGTYVEDGFSREKELLWMNLQIKTQVNGGETTNISEYSTLENAIKEFDQMNLTYLNRYYNVEVLKSWKNDQQDGVDGYTFIKNHLGYRFHIDSITIPKTVSLFQSLPIKIHLLNSGFAKPIRDFEPLLVVKRNGVIVEYPLTGKLDENDWYLSGTLKLKQLLFKDNSDVELGFKLMGKEPIQLANIDIDYIDDCYWFAKYSYNSNENQYQYRNGE